MAGNACRHRWLLALALCSLLGACGQRTEQAAKAHHYQWLLWHTPVELTVRVDPESQAADPDAVVAALRADWQTLERDWHSWKPSPLSDANQAFAAGRSAPLPDSLQQLLIDSRPLYAASEGLFDPAIGGLVRLWGFHSEDYPLLTPPPSAAELQQWLQQRPHLDQLERHGDLYLSRNPRLQLDFAAVAEGAALARGADILRAHGIEHALFNLGGDVLALGQAEGRPWRVAIEDPLIPESGVLADLPLQSGEGLFVSGGYRRFRLAVDGARLAHVLDPRTARPVHGNVLAAVVSDDPRRGDAGSTALLIAGPALMPRLLKRLQIDHALLLDDQDRLWITPALEQRLRWQRRPAQIQRVP